MGDHVVLAINGELSKPTPTDLTLSLQEYLHRETRYKGTKLGCAEGGCGACAVLVYSFDETTGESKVRTVNSCLAPVALLDGCSVVTAEGLGSSKRTFHPVQESIAAHHGSQCGFCTPGMVVACTAALHRAKAKGQNSPPSAEEMEKSIDGNLCRCTGFRPILDACKGVAADIEDLCSSSASAIPDFPDAIKEHAQARRSGGGVEYPSRDGIWLAPTSLAELFELLQKHEASKPRLVAGNTGAGVYKNWPVEPVVIGLGGVRELRTVERNEDSLRVGAATTLQELIELLRDSKSGKPIKQWLAMADHLDRIAGTHVRSAATIGGNLVLARNCHLESDVAPLLMALGAVVELTSKGGKTRSVSVESLLHDDQPLLCCSEVVTAVHIPTSNTHDYFWSSRVSHRFENSKALINAAVSIKYGTGQANGHANGHANGNANGTAHANGNSQPADVRVSIGYPGKDGWVCQRASHVEEAVRHALGSADVGVLGEVIASVVQDVSPASNVADYTLRAAEGMLLEGLAPLWRQAAEVNKQAPHPLLLADTMIKPSVVTGSQSYQEPDPSVKPVGQPLEKDKVKLQASGEAVYTGDLPREHNALYGAIIPSTEPCATITNIDTSSALALSGVHAVITAKDIPEGYRNQACGPPAFPGAPTEPIFADGRVGYVGQPVGMVLAESQSLAERAAKLVKVSYANEKAIITIEEAREANSTYPLPPMVKNPIHVGDSIKALTEAPHTVQGSLRIPSQYHFYMEPQTAMAKPDEGGQITVHSATQSIDMVQMAVANVLNVPFHNVTAVCRRAGGGFGGKALRQLPLASAVALSAAITNRSVRCSLNRNVDMQMIGGRCQTLAEYEIGFDNEGKITALKVNIWFENGAWLDFGLADAWSMSAALDQSYDIPNLSLEMFLCRCNVAPRTPMRGPGEMQAVLIIEQIIEHVAAHLGLEPALVRERNFLKPVPGLVDGAVEETRMKTALSKPFRASNYTLPRIWEQLKVECEYERRSREVEEFNNTHVWRKRGISMTQSRYGMSVGAKNAAVSIMQDGSVLVAYAGVEIGQGLGTKVQQAAIYELSQLLPESKRPLPLTTVRLADNNSDLLPNAGVTGGSTTSEGSLQAVRMACAKLCTSLQPFAEKLGDDYTWQGLIKAAYPMMGFGTKTLLSEYGFYGGTETDSDAATPLGYATFGAACSEVEIDVLTGERRLLRSDILFDCGRSLNPAVDIGQVEGAFVQGLGLCLSEEVIIDGQSGKNLTDSTWTYKIPSASCIPRQLNVKLLEDSPLKQGIMGSKACGEPPLLLSASVLTALQSATFAARKHLEGLAKGAKGLPNGTEHIVNGGGVNGVVGNTVTLLQPPANPQRILAACGNVSVANVLKQQLK